MLEIGQLRVMSGERCLLSVAQLSVGAGENLALLGPNGAGKSTLLRAISGELPGQGRIVLHGRDLSRWPARERARHLAVLPQSSHLAFPFSASEVVTLGLMPLSLSRTEGHSLVERCMREADCWHLGRRNFMGLSGGEKQRVHLARVLVQLEQAEQTPLLLLDEPVSAQDLGQQHSLLSMVRRLSRARSYTVLAVLHDLNQALRYSSRCLVLKEGRLVADGVPSAVLSVECVRRVWQYQPQCLHSDAGPVLV